ncbi:PilT-like protein [Beggiatoa sp. PS]|nr:PilT-like protein [Beggiatoa sp. PS]
MSNVVLDASALLAFLHNEKGAERVAKNVHGAIISTVNLTEVMTKLFEKGLTRETIQRILKALHLEMVNFDAEMASKAAELRLITRHLGLSLGDRACLAVAEQLNLPVLTTDKQWT